MADFKISRIRYTWKGNWNTSTLYKKDDVLFYGGSSWVCVRQHTSTVFADDQTYIAPGESAVKPAWRKMTDGRTFRGDWSTSTLYNPGDIVKYGGNLYLTIDSYTSTEDFEFGALNISTFVESINWRGNWTASTSYAVGDLVRYGAKTLKCKLAHISGTDTVGPEIGNDDGIEDSTLEVWELYYSAPNYRGDYSADNVRYKIDDVVLFNSNLLICVEPFISSSSFDQFKWNILADGQEFTAEWQDSRLYSIGSVVRYGGTVYLALKYNTNQNPADSIYQFNEPEGPYWQILAKGVNFVGTYSPGTNYKTGDVVLRGGVLYRCLIDPSITDDISTLDYLDDSNWEILIDSINFKGSWVAGVTYQKGDTIGYLGSLYRANIAHISSTGLDGNFPGDNGSGYDYWDLVLEAQTEVGMTNKGDLLTYNLSKSSQGDQSTFGITSVPIGSDGQLLSIDQEQDIVYKTYGEVARTFYVSTDGVDDIVDPRRGISQTRPWRTIRFACEQAADGFAGFTTIKVSTGKFEEILPIIVPARTVVRGDELRSVTIAPAGPMASLIDDDTYTVAALNRIKVVTNSLVGDILSFTKTSPNPLDPVSVEGTEQSQDAANSVASLIDTVVNYIRFKIDGVGTEPAVAGTNTAVTDTEYTDAVLILEANKEFLAAEAVAFIQQTYPSYEFDSDLFKRHMRNYIDAIKYDIIYTGNYKSILAARYYVNTIQGSSLEDMFYMRDATGLRNCTLIGLNGTLTAVTAQNLYQRATGGAYTSLDPGWGPADSRTWILTRSPYVQGVTNIGDRCVGIKIDGALHNGGNKSMVANDYTQVLSDGIGAWAENNGRTELVSVFSYYCSIGYYATSGGIIRATNGNNSYGDFGCIADGVDPTEIPKTASVNNRNQEAQVFQVIAGEFVDEITAIEFTNAGQNYTNASASFTGSGINASVSFEDFRDQAIFEARLIDVLPSATFIGSITDNVLTVTSVISGTIGIGYRLSGLGILEDTQIVSYGTGVGLTGDYNLNQSQTVLSTTITAVTTNLIAQYVGGGGYSVQQNNAQVHQTPGGDQTSITIASNDTNLEADYLGKRIIITSGTGTGQYGYITAYDTITKIVSVSKDSDDQPGWDHIISGKPLVDQFDTTTRYRIEPRVTFSEPGYSALEYTVPVTETYNNIVYGEITRFFNNIAGDLGTGSVIGDDGLTPSIATFDVTQLGRTYSVVINDPGAGYLVGDIITIEGGDLGLGGASPDNDLTITVTGISDDSTNSIISFTYDGVAPSGRFIGVPSSGSQGIYSPDGETWTAFNLPSTGDWRCLAAGGDRFVAIRHGSNAAASSNDGNVWTARTMPDSRNWNAVIYGGGKFVAVAGDQNSGAYSTDGSNWTAMSMPAFGDSTVNEWIDVAYGKGIFVAVANSQNISASSTDGINWEGHIMDVIADSTQKDWVSVTYGNNRFVAVSSQGDVAYSFDGALWYPATMPTQDGSTSHVWYKIRYGQGVFFAVGDTGSKDIGGDPASAETAFAATSPDGIKWTERVLGSSQEWRSVGFGNPYISAADSTFSPNSPMWIAAAANSDKISKMITGARAIGRAYVASGRIIRITLIDSGSAYYTDPVITITDPSATSDASAETRIGDGVLSNPEWINRGIGYRTTSTRVSIIGDGFSDIIPIGKFVTLDDLTEYPGLGSQIIFSGNTQRYIITSITELGTINGGLGATLRLIPELKVRDNLEHGTVISIQSRYSQIRITGHDFLDIGTGSFTDTNYPEIYQTGNYLPQPENEVYEEDGGRVFYTSTDQSGNFRTGELFAVEQATGIVTISADFFDLAGLTELRLGGIRIGGSGVVIREFSTDALFTADSNNIVPTQRAIAAYLNNRLTVGGSEIITSSFIAGLVKVGPDLIEDTVEGSVIFPQRADFEGNKAGVSGLMIAQSMFLKSFE